MTHIVNKVLVGIVAAVVLTGCNLVTFVEEETFTLPVEGHGSLEVMHDEGEVTITGEEGLEEIIVDVRYEVLGEELEEAETFYQSNTSISLESEGEVAKLVTSIRRGSEKEQANIHLDIRIPSNYPIHYRQNEGGLIVSNLQSDLEIQHGSGALRIMDVTGDVRLTDGAGKATFERIHGTLQLNINSGATTIQESTGDITLMAGSGDIGIHDHSGNITLRSGSGDVEVLAVDGDVTILEARGGKLELGDITGEVITP
ncbi:DUF4097 family beta strand repeat-containing protein [Alkalihalophilus sp. As8PL]|uniref:DUF4097 family beta strand repeat-containing protein n=1 Tax=Alkalihalophilus sp. As8PL TaxID=3237103 RepID=A0AB39BU30_9BACI